MLAIFIAIFRFCTGRGVMEVQLVGDAFVTCVSEVLLPVAGEETLAFHTVFASVASLCELPCKAL